MTTKRPRRKLVDSDYEESGDDSYVPSSYATGASSYAAESEDVATEMGNVEFDPNAYTGPIHRWTADSYTKARSKNPYEEVADSPTPQFRTKVQHDAFYGYLKDKSVFAHKKIDWNFLGKYSATRPLIDTFREIGLFNFTNFSCNWNDVVIRQFYATVYVDWDNAQITWMTNTNVYSASFNEFGVACHLIFQDLVQGEKIWETEPVSEERIMTFYKPAQLREIGHVSGLKTIPKVINKIIRFTLYPKAGNPEQIRDFHWNFIDCIMRRRKIHAIQFMLQYIEQISASFQLNLYYAPYIMALILSKTNHPPSSCPVRHSSYAPFGSKRALLVEDDEEEEENVDAAPFDQDSHPAPPQPPSPWQQWGSPPPGYFDPLMHRFDALDLSIQNIQTRQEQQFSAFEQSMQNIHTRQDNLEQRFTDFSTHFYGVLPPGPPPSGYMPYPYYQPMPPPPPQDDE